MVPIVFECMLTTVLSINPVLRPALTIKSCSNRRNIIFIKGLWVVIEKWCDGALFIIIIIIIIIISVTEQLSFHHYLNWPMIILFL